MRQAKSKSAPGERPDISWLETGVAPMQEMDRRIGFLRLTLADITDRERQAGETTRQLRAQLARVADATVQFNGSVTNALAAMSEIEERLAQQETQLRHLG